MKAGQPTVLKYTKIQQLAYRALTSRKECSTSGIDLNQAIPHNTTK